MTATTIRLYGELGRLFGRIHRVCLDTNSPAEAVRYLCSQFPRARAYFTGAGDRGVGFAVFRGKENLAEENLREPVGSDDIRIAPMLMGSKRGGVVNIIVGIVLVIVGIYTWNPNLIYLGAMTIVGGVIQMLTPIPRGGKGKDRPDNEPSYVFSGAVNTQAQGNPVPLLYGRMIVGSAVISAGIEAASYAPVNTGIGPGNPNFFPKNPYEIAQ